MKTLVNDGLKFVCATEAELWRARTLLTKEPGTIAWLKQLRDGDVFYDVGANVGCYAMYAARQVGPDGLVYAFEPHVGNAMALLRNVAANAFTDRVRVLTCALHSVAGGFVDCLPFHYRSLEPGSSGSQLNHATGEDGQDFSAAAVELKSTATINGLISNGIIRKPDAIKIDVDGNELSILNGLFEFATSSHWPRILQVETRGTNRAAVASLMADAGYALESRHRTKSGEKAVSSGADADAISDNSIYVRRPC